MHKQMKALKQQLRIRIAKLKQQMRRLQMHQLHPLQMHPLQMHPLRKHPVHSCRWMTLTLVLPTPIFAA